GPGVGDRGHRGRARRPGHLAGQILRRLIRVGAFGGERLDLSHGDAGIGRGDGDGNERRGGDRHHRRASDTVHHGTDSRGAGTPGGGRPGGGDRRHAGLAGGPRALAGQVLRGGVGEGPRGSELLRQALRHGGTGGGDGDRLQDRR